MLAVILKILSVIGIVLLCLLGLVIVLAVLILIMPVTYKISAKKDDETPLTAAFKASYFLGLVRAVADYDKVLNVNVMVLWFKLFSMTIPDKSEDEDDDMFSGLDDPLDDLFNDGEYMAEEEDNSDIAELTELTDSYEAEESAEISEAEDEDGSPDADTPAEPEETERSETSDESEEEDSDEEKENIFDKIKYKLSSIYDKIQDVRSEIRYYRNVYNSNEAKNALRVIKKRIVRILKKILPRRIHADVTYGFSSPDMTGKVYGIYCLIRKRFDRRSVVIPDFDRQIFKGTVRASGIFNLWGILINAICVVLNRNVIKIYRSIKHHNGKKKKEAEEIKNAA